MAIRKHLNYKISWSSSHFRAVISDSLKTKQMSLFGSMLFMVSKFSHIPVACSSCNCKEDFGSANRMELKPWHLLGHLSCCRSEMNVLSGYLHYRVNSFATDQWPQVRNRRIIVSRSSAKLVGLMSGWVWKIEVLSPLKKKLYPAVNFPSPIKCRRAFMSIQFLLIWTQNQNKFRYSQPFWVYQKHIRFFILKGRTFQENVIILFLWAWRHWSWKISRHWVPDSASLNCWTEISVFGVSYWIAAPEDPQFGQPHTLNTWSWRN